MYVLHITPCIYGEYNREIYNNSIQIFLVYVGDNTVQIDV